MDYDLDLWGRVRDLVAAGTDEAQAEKADLAKFFRDPRRIDPQALNERQISFRNCLKLMGSRPRICFTVSVTAAVA